ncbi:hypothetical protein BS47DRAFT_676145 [Hydnum rufescens UP504]|uniref:Uncharacterized protein n=1 Tax=Hydnum rufescens UP504 TaxID=1448309 RepID=A0A9P6B267_9AGAM|nr:hypothetical protein BS47DRAFT_676145 [Hydnum rufescens UP504]
MRPARSFSSTTTFQTLVLLFRPQTPEELLDTLGLGGIWPLWDLSSASPDAGIVPQTPGGPKSDFNFSRNRWPHSCRCSAIMPVIHAINAQKLVRGVAFAFKPFSSFLKQYKRGEFPHHALQDAVQPWCAACCIMYKRIGVRFEDLASDPSKEPLASVSYTDADDLEVPEYDSDLPTRPSSATSSMHRPAQDPHSALPSSSRHTLPPPPSHMPHRSNSSPRVLPEQVSSDRDSATPSRRSTPLIQRSWMRSPTISRGQTFNQQAPPQESQESKGDAPFNALNSHARPSPTPPMPRLQPGATGDKLGQFGVASELRRSPLTRSPIHASGSYPPRPSSAGASHLHNVAKADTQYHRPPSVSGYTTPPFSPQSSHRSTTRQAPVLPEPLHSSPSRSKKNRPRPTPEGSQAPHPYLADQPSAFATFSSPIDASGMHIPRTESTSWTMYQPAPATDPTDYDSWKGQQQPPIADFPNHHTASASHHWQSSPPYPIQHQPQPYAYAPQWPSPSGYPTGVQPSRLPTTPGSNPHFPSAQHPPHRHDHEQHNLYHGGPDYEVVHHQLPMQQQQNYRGGPTSSTPYQMYTPRAHHQPPQPESFYPSPSHSYPRTHAMSRETEYNYNDDTRLYEKVNPVYPR